MTMHRIYQNTDEDGDRIRVLLATEVGHPAQVLVEVTTNDGRKIAAALADGPTLRDLLAAHFPKRPGKRREPEVGDVVHYSTAHFDLPQFRDGIGVVERISRTDGTQGSTRPFRVRTSCGVVEGYRSGELLVLGKVKR